MKRIAHRFLRHGRIAAGAAGLLFFVLVTLRSSLGVYLLSYVPPPVYGLIGRRPFDPKVWGTEGAGGEGDVRLQMLDDLQRRHRLVGMSRPQAHSLLGRPDGEDSTRMTYRLGDERGWISIDSEWLTLTFDANGRVQKIEVWRD